MDKLITPEQLAERWGMSQATLKKWRHLKRGPAYIKLGGKEQKGNDNVRYSLKDIIAYESKNTVKVTA
jgi:transposase-like protein